MSLDSDWLSAAGEKKIPMAILSPAQELSGIGFAETIPEEEKYCRESDSATNQGPGPVPRDEKNGHKAGKAHCRG